MRFIPDWAPWALTATLLAACGGGGDGDQSAKVHYSALVSFGDSLSDVGTHATTGLVGLTGGGKYTINSASAKNWTELLAAQLGLPAPCAAQTGLESVGLFADFAQAKADHPGCLNYAQGGARVTNPVGPGNKALLALGDLSGELGQLTDPVIHQISRHLVATGTGRFSGTELVTVMAGGNDVLVNLAGVASGTQTQTQAVTAAGVAGGTLADYIKTLIVANGATHVVLVNLPDLSQTPSAIDAEAKNPGAISLISAMVTMFNSQLASGLAGTSGVLIVDAYAQGRDQTAHPAQYQLTDVTHTACALSDVVFNSLVCSTATLNDGDVSHYLYADTVHPTPWGYRLLAQFVTQKMLQAGWL